MIDEEQVETHLIGVMRALCLRVRLVAVALKPILPDTAARIYESFQFGPPFEDVDFDFLCGFSRPCWNDGNRLVVVNGDSAVIFNRFS